MREREGGRERPLFSLGQVVATPGALALLQATGTRPETLIARHVTGDWGELDEHDIRMNNEALVYGNRLLSSYRLQNGEKLWIITEWDRSVTTLLLPSEY